MRLTRLSRTKFTKSTKFRQYLGLRALCERCAINKKTTPLFVGAIVKADAKAKWRKPENSSGRIEHPEHTPATEEAAIANGRVTIANLCRKARLSTNDVHETFAALKKLQ